MVDNINMIFIVKFETSDLAKIVYDSILPEVNDHRFERSKMFIKLNSANIKFNITSRDISAAKANINTIFRWIGVISESINFVSKKIVKRNDIP